MGVERPAEDEALHLALEAIAPFADEDALVADLHVRESR
jgi:hypothetical protein